MMKESPYLRSMATATRYFQLFLPTAKDIPAEQSWHLWLPLLDSYWKTWGNSPSWEVDIIRLYSRLAQHRVGQVDWDKYEGSQRENYLSAKARTSRTPQLCCAMLFGM